MELVSLILIAVFCIVGGIIAYGADLLGRSLGKKRLSIFGLRPRYTAALITTTAGVLLPLLTAVLLWSISEEVQFMFAHATEARSQLAKANEQLKRTEVEVQTALAQRQASVEAAEQAKAKYEKSVADLRSRVAGFRRNVEVLQSKVATSRSQLQAITQELNASKSQLKLVNQLQKEALAQRQEFLDRNTELIRETTSLEAEIRKLNDQAVQAKERLNEKEHEVQQATSNLNVAQGALSDLQQLMVKTEKEFQKLVERSIELQAQVRNLEISRQNLIGVRNADPMFVHHQELARLSVPAGTSLNDARNLLASLLRTARLEAERNGARPNKETNDMAADLIPLESATVEQQRAKILREIAGKKEPALMIAYCPFNAYIGEFVPLKVEVFNNPKIYMQGAVVAETKIDAGQPSVNIFSELFQFVTVKVKDEAMKDRLIPRRGNAELFGSVGTREIMELCEQLRPLGRTVRVQAVAAQETRAGDALKLEFRIR